jgi:hypothetical protein
VPPFLASVAAVANETILTNNAWWPQRQKWFLLHPPRCPRLWGDNPVFIGEFNDDSEQAALATSAEKQPVTKKLADHPKRLGGLKKFRP